MGRIVKVKATPVKVNRDEVDTSPNDPETEARIQAAIAADPDTWTPPPGHKPIGRGRPRGSRKTRVTTMLDNDVIAALKEGGEKGWQTRLNATLRQALGL